MRGYHPVPIGCIHRHEDATTQSRLELVQCNRLGRQMTMGVEQKREVVIGEVNANTRHQATRGGACTGNTSSSHNNSLVFAIIQFCNRYLEDKGGHVPVEIVRRGALEEALI